MFTEQNPLHLPLTYICTAGTLELELPTPDWSLALSLLRLTDMLAHTPSAISALTKDCMGCLLCVLITLSAQGCVLGLVRQAIAARDQQLCWRARLSDFQDGSTGSNSSSSINIIDCWLQKHKHQYLPVQGSQYLLLKECCLLHVLLVFGFAAIYHPRITFSLSVTPGYCGMSMLVPVELYTDVIGCCALRCCCPSVHICMHELH